MAGITHWWDVAQHVFAPSSGDPRKCVHCLCDRYDTIHKTSYARPLTRETGQGGGTFTG